MKQFRITWGPETVTVYATDANDAWAKFAQGHSVASQHPKLHERKVEEVKQVESKPVAPPIKRLVETPPKPNK